jgi:hypothetical protein
MVHYGFQANTIAIAAGPMRRQWSPSQGLSVEFQQTGLEFMFSCAEFMRKCPGDDVAKSGR